MQRNGQSDNAVFDPKKLDLAPKSTYFYIGNIINHYGHFLCSSMARFWALKELDVASLPLLGHGVGGPKNWFSWPFAQTLFGVAGITESDFSNFTRPTFIKEIIIAQPSFIERNRSHSKHAESAHRLGDRLTKIFDDTRRHDIIYISKTKYGKNPDGFSNELEIAEIFHDAGIWVIYPEQLSLGEQIAYFRGARKIVGACSSAFHTAVFSEPTSSQRLFQLATSPDVCSTNHWLMDYCNNLRSTYVYLDGEWHNREGANPGFRIKDPASAGRQLLEFVRQCD